MKELLIDKTEIDKTIIKEIESIVNKKYEKLFKESEGRLKKNLEEYNTAYQNASRYYVK